MPRDYKHRAQRKPKKKPLSGWVWLVTGLMLGAFAVSLVWLSGQSETSGGEWVGAKPDRPPQGPSPSSSAPSRRVEVPAPPKPRFDFYNMLPKDEIIVTDEELEERRPATPAQQADDAVYLVQVGSFKRNADADRLKAQLALLGIEASVVSARIGPQDTRYRVRSGPYSGRAALDKARARMTDNGLKGIVIELKQR